MADSSIANCVDLRGRRVLVHADLHLSATQPAEIEAFCRELDAQRSAVDAIVILGDLFDAWVGPEQWQEPSFEPLRATLKAVVDDGRTLVLVRGNRDVLLEPRDGEPVGATVADHVLVAGTGSAEDASARVFLTHGDEFCLRDRPYQRLRRTLRNRPLRAVLRHLPYGLRLRLAARLRGISRGAVARKPLDTLALVEEAVAARLESVRAARAVIGHLHVSEERDLGSGRRLTILPAWAPGSPGTIL